MICLADLSAQSGSWTWMKGTGGVNPTPVFGVMGVPDNLNNPPGLYEAAEWTDLNGNFWVFGGVDFTTSDIHSVLWRFDPVTLEWTWMKGPSATNQVGVYGTQGVPSPLNYPGSRSYAMVTWVDAAGDLWMYGGSGFDITGVYGSLDELWRYNIATNEWTWMKGSGLCNQPGIYGTLQVPSPLSNPPGLVETACGWTDAAGDLWMFGGLQIPTIDMNDVMWRYNIATNTWTWMSGQNAPQVAPNYGTLQVPAASNTPGSRQVYAHWEDLQGNFWLFGGMDSPVLLNCYADMWMYNPNTLQWTWMAGTSAVNGLSTFTNQCVPGGHPQAVFENRVYWRDECGRFWSMSGANNDFTLGYNPTFSTLWCFDPNTLQFTWVGGPLAPEIPAVFGTQGVPSPSNHPHSLIGPQSFVSQNGDLWLAGGCQISGGLFNAVNTVWRYQIDPACPLSPLISNVNAAQPLTGCAPYQIQFSPSLIGNYSYFWDFGDTTTLADTSNAANAAYTFLQPGTYTVTLITTSVNTCTESADTSAVTVTVYPQPSVNLGSDTTLCNAPVTVLLDAGNPGATYQWSTGATSQQITASAAGTYSVAVTSDPNGLCSAQDTIVISLAAQPVLSGDTTICAGQTLLLDPGVNAQQFIWNTGDTTSTLPVSATGFYSVQVINAPCTLSTSMNLTVAPQPAVALGPDTTLCPGDAITLNAQNTGANYNWNTGATSQSIVVSDAGTYAVTVTAQNCAAADTVNISFTQNINFNETVSLCGSPGGIVLDAGNPGANYLWSTGETSQTITIQQAGTYWVSINAAPCTLSDTIEVTGTISEGTVYIPNSFTPNGNGLNDRFTGYGENFTSFRLMIFNRWGELIFETTDPNGWDGFYAGQQAKGDVYVYKLTYTSSCTGGKFVDRLGHVTLIR
ncbi:MAG: gliding motility-associated C-terminal domain-containing protein [Bacteroidia bacterium]|nr:gliding motility-associated C-terminal domain-containing protein [Bacteroidia bacterium]